MRLFVCTKKCVKIYFPHLRNHPLRYRKYVVIFVTPLVLPALAITSCSSILVGASGNSKLVQLLCCNVSFLVSFVYKACYQNMYGKLRARGNTWKSITSSCPLSVSVLRKLKKKQSQCVALFSITSSSCNRRGPNTKRVFRNLCCPIQNIR